MKWLGGVLVFGAELGMYAGLFWWGYSSFEGYWGWLIGLSVPFFVSVIWSVKLSPRAPKPFPTPLKIGVRLALMLAGAAAWLVTDWTMTGLAVAAAALIGTVIATRWPFDVTPRHTASYGTEITTPVRGTATAATVGEATTGDASTGRHMYPEPGASTEPGAPTELDGPGDVTKPAES